MCLDRKRNSLIKDRPSSHIYPPRSHTDGTYSRRNLRLYIVQISGISWDFLAHLCLRHSIFTATSRSGGQFFFQSRHVGKLAIVKESRLPISGKAKI